MRTVRIRLPEKADRDFRQIKHQRYYPACFQAAMAPDPNKIECTGCALCAVCCPDVAIEVYRETKGESKDKEQDKKKEG